MRWIPANLVMVVMTLGPGIGPAQGQQQAPPNAFDLTDTNRDGRITPAEYQTRMLEVFFLLDRNKDGALVCGQIPGASVEAVRAADRNGDGAALGPGVHGRPDQGLRGGRPEPGRRPRPQRDRGPVATRSRRRACLRGRFGGRPAAAIEPSPRADDARAHSGRTAAR